MQIYILLIKNILYSTILLILTLSISSCGIEHDFKKAIEATFYYNGHSMVGKFIQVSDNYNRFTNNFQYNTIISNDNKEVLKSLKYNERLYLDPNGNSEFQDSSFSGFATQNSTNLENYEFLVKVGLLSIVKETNSPIYIYDDNKQICDNNNQNCSYVPQYKLSDNYRYHSIIFKVTDEGEKYKLINTSADTLNNLAFSIYSFPLVQSIDNYVYDADGNVIITYTMEYKLPPNWYKNNKLYIDTNFLFHGQDADSFEQAVSGKIIKLYHGAKGWIA